MNKRYINKKDCSSVNIAGIFQRTWSEHLESHKVCKAQAASVQVLLNLSLSKPSVQALNGTVSLSGHDPVTFQESKVGHSCHHKV